MFKESKFEGVPSGEQSPEDAHREANMIKAVAEIEGAFGDLDLKAEDYERALKALEQLRKEAAEEGSRVGKTLLWIKTIAEVLPQSVVAILDTISDVTKGDSLNNALDNAIGNLTTAISNNIDRTRGKGPMSATTELEHVEEWADDTIT